MLAEGLRGTGSEGSMFTETRSSLSFGFFNFELGWVGWGAFNEIFNDAGGRMERNRK